MQGGGWHALRTGPGRGVALSSERPAAAFGLDTAPAMTASGCGSRLVIYKTRLAVYRLAAVFVLVIGVMTIWRALPAGEGAAPRHDVPVERGVGSACMADLAV